MRLFFYYLTHSLFNTIKKLMKTWVAFILIVMVFGMVVGLVASLFDKDDKGSGEPQESVINLVEEDEDPGEEISIEEAASGRLAKRSLIESKTPI